MWTFFWNFLKFFSKTGLSLYFCINCTNFSKIVKFIKIVFYDYLNFIKLSNIKFSERQVQNFMFFVKFTQIHSYFTQVSYTFSQWFWRFLQVFPYIPLIFFQNFDKYYLKLILFKNFRCIFSTVPHSLNDILLNLLLIPQIFSKIYWKFR